MAKKSLVKTVPLSDDQFDRVSESLLSRSDIGKVIAATLIQLSEDLARNERNCWETLWRLTEADRELHVITVDFVNRCVLIYDRDPQDEED